MEPVSDKSERIIRALRGSIPEIGNKDLLTEKIMSAIRNERLKTGVPELVFESVFGWVYIGWMRRLMVTAALGLIILFGFQQVVILRRINRLSGKVQIENNSADGALPAGLSNKLRIIKLYGNGADEKISISEKDIDRFIESANDIQDQYRDIIEIINNDPLLKKYFEEKIGQTDNKKPKI
jgi:hypothetical protein